MRDPDLLLWLLGLAGVVIGALTTVLVWFVRKDRNAFFMKLREHGRRLDELETDTDRVKAVVFGLDGSGGVNKWEHVARNLMQPVTSRVDDMNGKFDRLVIALARALPNLDIRDVIR